ncbi:LacI family DNA-binding transcriptional regulator [Candidatus Symbiopectobacterium endolongispinus]|uniref:LacI family DNA-binding transcriptional regulator n=1 Tax=Candidatus Symbiopectobacterium sp. PLON1 TaxID=2794575 RepID=UPI0027E1E594|nr:LacI family DNA-binding transcriptional regulator [Candidatus Symbiopectobacterium endolongispinus]
MAKKVGVSKATVSRVLNGKNVVREDMRQRVFRAIEETGFSPNLLARQLATRKTN